MFRFRLFAAAAILAVSAASAHAATYSFKTIDDAADPTFNQLLGIADNGLISGYFGSGAAGHPNKGYTIASPYTVFVNTNLPGSAQTQVTGLSTAGYETGFWSDTNLGPNAQGAPQDANFGWIRTIKNGVSLFLDVNNPAVTSVPHINQVLGINTSGNAAGFYNDANGASHAYIFSAVTGKFTNLNELSNVVSAAATGINKNNLVCGFVTTTGGSTRGFLRALSGSTPIYFGVPGSTNTQFLGVNDSGTAVGFYADGNGIDHGVIYDPTSGNWTSVNAPGAVGGTVLNGLNNKNQIVGFYTDAAGNTHGVLVTVTP